jgi:hypothetical protein
MSAWVRQTPRSSAVGYLIVVEKTGIAVAVLCRAADWHGSEADGRDSYPYVRFHLSIAETCHSAPGQLLPDGGPDALGKPLTGNSGYAIWYIV